MMTPEQLQLFRMIDSRMNRLETKLSVIETSTSKTETKLAQLTTKVNLYVAVISCAVSVGVTLAAKYILPQ